MKSKGQECNSSPDAYAVIHHVSLDEELASSAVKEMEQPLLGCIRSVVPDVASSVTRLLVEVLFTVPSLVHHLWNSQTFTVDKSDIFHISKLVMGQSSACIQ